MTSSERVLRGIEKYTWIMDRILTVDVSIDTEFQRRFNGFFRMRQRPADFYNCFYTFLEENKHNQQLTFEDVITYLYDKTGSIHASFSSKLLAAVNPDMPIWDQFVLKNLGLRPPYYYEKDRLQKTIALYDKIRGWYTTADAAEKLSQFNVAFPEINISNTKKIDFILWSSR